MITHLALLIKRAGLAFLLSLSTFHIVLDVDMTFDELTGQINRRLSERPVKIAEPEIRVEHVRVYRNGDDLVLETALSGGLDAVVYLTGRPVYHPDTQELTVERLIFSAGTRSLLAQPAAWLLHDDLEQQLVENTRFPLREKIGAIQQSLEQGLNRSIRDRIALQGTATTLKPRGVYILPNAFRTIIAAAGRVAVRVEYQ